MKGEDGLFHRPFPIAPSYSGIGTGAGAKPSLLPTSPYPAYKVTSSTPTSYFFQHHPIYPRPSYISYSTHHHHKADISSTMTRKIPSIPAPAPTPITTVPSETKPVHHIQPINNTANSSSSSWNSLSSSSKKTFVVTGTVPAPTLHYNLKTHNGYNQAQTAV